MIFEPAVCRQILTGRKTQARILVTDERQAPVRKGHTVAIQPGVGKKAFGRALVVDVFQQHLKSITYQEARAEGFKTSKDFLEDWRSQHDSEGLVWVIVLSLDADEPRLMTPSSRPKGTVHGYTSNPSLAMRGSVDPGEALTDSQLADLSRYRPAMASERRTGPLMAATDRIARELDQMQAELRTGSYSQQARRAVRSLRRQLGALEAKL